MQSLYRRMLDISSQNVFIDIILSFVPKMDNFHRRVDVSIERVEKFRRSIWVCLNKVMLLCKALPL